MISSLRIFDDGFWSERAAVLSSAPTQFVSPRSEFVFLYGTNARSSPDDPSFLGPDASVTVSCFAPWTVLQGRQKVMTIELDNEQWE